MRLWNYSVVNITATSCKKSLSLTLTRKKLKLSFWLTGYMWKYNSFLQKCLSGWNYWLIASLYLWLGSHGFFYKDTSCHPSLLCALSSARPQGVNPPSPSFPNEVLSAKQNCWFATTMPSHQSGPCWLFWVGRRTGLDKGRGRHSSLHATLLQGSASRWPLTFTRVIMGWVTLNSLRLSDAYICVSKLTIIGSYNGLSSGGRQAIICTNVGTSLIGPLRTNFGKILIKIDIFSYEKMHLKMSSGNLRPFCLGLNVLKCSDFSFRPSLWVDFWWRLTHSQLCICCWPSTVRCQDTCWESNDTFLSLKWTIEWPTVLYCNVDDYAPNRLPWGHGLLMHSAMTQGGLSC